MALWEDSKGRLRAHHMEWPDVAHCSFANMCDILAEMGIYVDDQSALWKQAEQRSHPTAVG